MNLVQLNNLFNAVSAGTVGVASYTFGWPSDRARSRSTDDTAEVTGALFPRVLWAVPELTQDTSRNQDTYQVQLFFDDLLGYDNDGAADDSTQLQKWRSLLLIASAWVKYLKSSQSVLAPDGIMITGPVQITLDSFASTQRLISVVVSFPLVTNTTCGEIVDFPDGVPSGIILTGDWIKGEQDFNNATDPELTWTANALDLTDAWLLDVYQGGQLLSADDQYTLATGVVTIDAATHYIGANYFIRAIWSL